MAIFGGHYSADPKEVHTLNMWLRAGSQRPRMFTFHCLSPWRGQLSFRASPWSVPLENWQRVGGGLLFCSAPLPGSCQSFWARVLVKHCGGKPKVPERNVARNKHMPPKERQQSSDEWGCVVCHCSVFVMETAARSFATARHAEMFAAPGPQW